MPSPGSPFSEQELNFLNALAVLYGWDLRVSGQGIHDGGVFTPWLQAPDEDRGLLSLVLPGKSWCGGGPDDEFDSWERVEDDPDTTEARRTMAFAALPTFAELWGRARPRGCPVSRRGVARADGPGL